MKKYVLNFAQGFPLTGLSGNGYNTTVISTANNISNSNPALINNFDRPTLGFSYLFSTEVDKAYINSIGYKKIKNEIPNSFGFILPIMNNFNMALGFNQSYNKSFDLNIPYTTIEYPDGAPHLPSFRFFEKTLIYGFDLTIAYSFKHLFSGKDKLSIGTNASFNFLDNDAYDYQYSSKFSNSATGFKIGAVYENQYKDNKYYSVGLFFEKAPSFKDFVDVELPTISSGVQNRDSLIFHIRKFQHQLDSEMPNKLSLGFSISPLDRWVFSSEIKNIFYSETHENLKNQIEFAANASFLLKDNLTITGGVFYTGRNYKKDIWGVNNETDGVFLIGGLIAKFDFVNLDLSIADGHLFSGEARKQTIFRLGAGISF